MPGKQLFRIDSNKRGRATGQDFVVGIPDLACVRVPAPVNALLLGSDSEHLPQRNGLEVLDFHGTGEGQHVTEFVHLAHGFVQDGGDNAAVRVPRRPGVFTRQLEMANGLARSFVQRELQAHALRIVMAAAETVVLAGLGFALNCVAVRNFAFCHGCEASILAFVSALKTFETRRKGGSRVFENFGPVGIHWLCYSSFRV